MQSSIWRLLLSWSTIILQDSQNDDHVTKLVKEACELMGIVLLDHLIVSHSNYFSYREKTDLI